MMLPADNNHLKHLEYLGLKTEPFPLTPLARDLYTSKSIDQIIVELVHGILTRKGFLILTGEIGLGKTTISRRLMAIMEEKGVTTSLVFHTFFQGIDLLRQINRDFGLEAVDATMTGELAILNTFLLRENDNGRNCVIMIDDAQNLDAGSLELIRLISNLETDHHKLVQIVLIGQPELLDKLNTHELRQLKSRIAIQKSVEPLSRRDLKEYLSFKLYSAGDRGGIEVKNDAIALAHRLTRGNIRQINILLDRTLYAVYLHSSNCISRKLIREAAIDLKMMRPQRSLLYAAGIAVCVLLAAVSFKLYRTLAPDFSLPLAFSNTAAPQQDSPPALPPPAPAPLPAAATPEEKAVNAGLIIEAPPGSLPVAATPAVPMSDAAGGAAAVSEAPPLSQDLGALQATDPAVHENPAAMATAAIPPRAAADPLPPATAAPEEPASISPEPPEVPPEIEQFLAAHGLHDFAASFYAALKSDQLSALARTIQEKSGYQLIVLSEVPEQIKANFDLLGFDSISLDGEKGAYAVFWKPKLEIQKFYWGYEGAEIVTLQNLLLDAGFYHDTTDGIVGKNLMAAVLQFQGSSKLPLTGFPGKTMLFLLCNQNPESKIQ